MGTRCAKSHLMPAQRVMAWLFVTKPSRTYDEISHAMWGHCADGGPDSVPNNIHQQLYRLRKFLRANGLDLEITVRGTHRSGIGTTARGMLQLVGSSDRLHDVLIEELRNDCRPQSQNHAPRRRRRRASDPGRGRAEQGVHAKVG